MCEIKFYKKYYKKHYKEIYDDIVYILKHGNDITSKPLSELRQYVLHRNNLWARISSKGYVYEPKDIMKWDKLRLLKWYDENDTANMNRILVECLMLFIVFGCKK